MFLGNLDPETGILVLKTQTYIFTSLLVTVLLSIDQAKNLIFPLPVHQDTILHIDFLNPVMSYTLGKSAHEQNN